MASFMADEKQRVGGNTDCRLQLVTVLACE
jgi:hypothetical protein